MSGLDLLISQKTYVVMLAIAFLVGVTMGGVYDFWRILRMAIGDTNAWPRGSAGREPSPRRVHRALLCVGRFVGDLVFSLIVAVAFILLCYYTNDGQLRAPAVIGMACGFFAYIQTVSRLVLALAALCLRLCRKLLRSLARLLLRLGKLLFTGLVLYPARLASRLAVALWSRTGGRLLEHRRSQAAERRFKDLQKQAAHGFFDED